MSDREGRCKGERGGKREKEEMKVIMRRSNVEIK